MESKNKICPKNSHSPWSAYLLRRHPSSRELQRLRFRLNTDILQQSHRTTIFVPFPRVAGSWIRGWKGKLKDLLHRTRKRVLGTLQEQELRWQNEAVNLQKCYTTHLDEQYQLLEYAFVQLQALEQKCQNAQRELQKR